MVLQIKDYESLFSQDKRVSKEIEYVIKNKEEIVVGKDKSADTDSLNEALNLVEKGGIIRLKDGTYETDKKIVMKSNITIIGDSWNSIIRTSYNGDWNDAAIEFDGKSNILIKNLKIEITINDSLGTGDTNIGLGYSTGAENVTFDKVWFEKINDGGTQRYGLVGVGGGNGVNASDIEFFNCKFSNGTNGDAIMGIEHTAFTRLVIKGCYMPSLNILGQSGGGAIVDNSIIVNNRGEDLIIWDGSKNIINSNIIGAIQIHAEDATSDFNIINGNIVTTGNTITITNADCNKNIITSNQTDTAISDAGTNTVLDNNNEY